MKVTLDPEAMDKVLKAEIDALKKENKKLRGRVIVLERQQQLSFTAKDLCNASDYLRQARDALDGLLKDRETWGGM